MEEYRVKPFRKEKDNKTWFVVEGKISYGDFVEGETVFIGSISDCYAWIKCKQEGLFKI